MNGETLYPIQKPTLLITTTCNFFVGSVVSSFLESVIVSHCELPLILWKKLCIQGQNLELLVGMVHHEYYAVINFVPKKCGIDSRPMNFVQIIGKQTRDWISNTKSVHNIRKTRHGVINRPPIQMVQLQETIRWNLNLFSLQIPKATVGFSQIMINTNNHRSR